MKKVAALGVLVLLMVLPAMTPDRLSPAVQPDHSQRTFPSTIAGVGNDLRHDLLAAMPGEDDAPRPVARAASMPTTGREAEARKLYWDRFLRAAGSLDRPFQVEALLQAEDSLAAHVAQWAVLSEEFQADKSNVEPRAALAKWLKARQDRAPRDSILLLADAFIVDAFPERAVYAVGRKGTSPDQALSDRGVCVVDFRGDVVFAGGNRGLDAFLRDHAAPVQSDGDAITVAIVWSELYWYLGAAPLMGRTELLRAAAARREAGWEALVVTRWQTGRGRHTMHAVLAFDGQGRMSQAPTIDEELELQPVGAGTRPTAEMRP